MNQDEAKAKIRALTAPLEPEVGDLLLNFGLQLVACGEDARITKDGAELGKIDFIFKDTDLRIILLIEVCTQRTNISEKIDHFFSRWSAQENIERIRSQCDLSRTYRIVRVYFELSGKESVSDSLCHLLNGGNIVLLKYDFDYFRETYKKIGKWARNDFFSFLDVRPTRQLTEAKDAIQFFLGRNRAYAYVDTAKNLLQYCYIYRKKKADKGYQRVLKTNRIRKIARGIETGKIFAFPNAILLSCPDVPKLCDDRRSESECPTHVKVNIPCHFCACRVIDGQHRLLSFANLAEKHQESHFLPVVIFEDIGLHEEIRAFIEINSGQQSIEKNLILALKADFTWDIKENEKEFFEKQAVQIATQLNEKPPLKNKVYIPQALAERKGKIALATLVSAICGNNFIGKRIHLYQPDQTDITLPLKKIKNIFVLAKRDFPQHCADARFSFFSTRGVRILLRLVQLFERNCLSKQLELSIEQFFKDLGKIFDDKLIGRLEQYYGEGGAAIAVVEILRALKKYDVQTYGKLATDLRKI